MFADHSYTPRGLHVTRAAIAFALAGGSAAAEEFALRRWGAESGARFVVRAAVGAGGSGGSWGSELPETEGAAAEFVEYVRGLTAFDQLPGLRRVAKGVPVVTETSASVATWRKQGMAAAVTSAAFDRTALWPLSLSALAVFSSDTLRDQSLETELGIQRTMAEAIAAANDAAAFDPTNAGTSNKMPAALSYGAPSFASIGDVQADVENALSEFGGALRTSVWIANPKTLAVIGFAAGGKGAACDVGALGGRIAGLPALPCEQLEADSNGIGPIVLIDGASVIVCDEGIELRPSTISTIEMDTEPAQDALAPAAPTGAVISLFQSDSAALMSTRRIAWRLARANACVVIESAGYGAS
jgi:hypothetical protein